MKINKRFQPKKYDSRRLDRTTSERLKREKLLFQTKSKPYDGEEVCTLLVEQCETIMQNEVQGWLKLVSKEK